MHRRARWPLVLLVVAALGVGVALGLPWIRSRTAPAGPQTTPAIASTVPTSTETTSTPSAEASGSAVPTAAAAPTPVKLSVSAAPVRTPGKVTCTVSAKTPLQKTSVTVTSKVTGDDGRPLSGAKVTFTWGFATGAVKTNATTDSSGIARSRRNIGTAKAGAKVTVRVKATAGSASASGSTSFTPKAPAPKVAATQKVSVDLSRGKFDPSTIHLKAGVPADITFGRGGGCLASVHSSSLGFDVDVTSGPKTVHLGPLKPGTYSFSCGMNMVFGSVVVS